MEVDDDFINEILVAEEKNNAINYALKLLSYRQRSEKEMCDSLKRKGFDEDIINHTLEYCKERDYLNDRKFAKALLRIKLIFQSLAPKE